MDKVELDAFWYQLYKGLNVRGPSPVRALIRVMAIKKTGFIIEYSLVMCQSLNLV